MTKVDDLECKVDAILNNHLPHIQNSIIETKTDVEWIKKFLWVIISTSTGALIVGLINLLINN